MSGKKYPDNRKDHETYCGDCAIVLNHHIPDDSVDLIVTSPPYIDAREDNYKSVELKDYERWFMDRAKEFRRVLKPTGSFVLNIKEGAKDGERLTYVLDLIIALKDQGWRWTEEYIWHKKNCTPGKWPNRFRDAWERCLHFTVRKDFFMDQEAVMVPMGDWADKRLANLNENDRRRDESKSESGFGKNVSNWVGREMAYPSNVLHLATECCNRGHSAAFPESLPEFFIKLFTRESDVVLDPFAGSGTTCVVAKRLNRKSIGIDIHEKHVRRIEERLRGV